jgi:WD40 repeat protein
VLPLTNTAYGNGAEIVSMSLIDDMYAVVVDNTISAPFYLRIYDLTTQSLFQQLTPGTNELTEVEYSSVYKTIYVGSKDQTIRAFSLSPITNLYEMTSVTYTNDFGTGIVREMSSEFEGYLFAIVDLYLVEYQIDSVGRLTYSQNFSLTAAGQTIDIHYPYVVVGLDGGVVTMF